MIRHFGVAAYAEVMTWPQRLILRAVEIEGERRAARREEDLTDLSISDSMDQGRKYVDPSAPSTSGGPYHDLGPYNAHVAALGRAARPWEHTQEAAQAQREAEEDAMWDKFRQVAGSSCRARA